MGVGDEHSFYHSTCKRDLTDDKTGEFKLTFVEGKQGLFFSALQKDLEISN
jgi:hypothetical protein